MRRFSLIAFTLTTLFAGATLAADRQIDYGRITKEDASVNHRATADVDYGAMEASGFGNVADLLKSMTPEQRQQVLELAAKRQKELERMTPGQRKRLEAQLLEITNMIEGDVGFGNIDPAKLNTAKSKNLQGTLADIETYKRERVN